MQQVLKNSKYFKNIFVKVQDYFLKVGEKPGLNSRSPHKPSGLVAQSCNPATGGQGYFDGAGHLGMLSWLGLDLLVSLMGLKTQAVSDMCKINGSRPQGTGHCTRAV